MKNGIPALIDLSAGIFFGPMKATIMQFYWRIIEELRYLGETLVFYDPGLIRQYNWWLQKNSVGLAFSTTDYTSSVAPIFSNLRAFTSLN